MELSLQQRNARLRLTLLPTLSPASPYVDSVFCASVERVFHGEQIFTQVER